MDVNQAQLQPDSGADVASAGLGDDTASLWSIPSVETVPVQLDYNELLLDVGAPPKPTMASDIQNRNRVGPVDEGLGMTASGDGSRDKLKSGTKETSFLASDAKSDIIPDSQTNSHDLSMTSAERDIQHSDVFREPTQLPTEMVTSKVPDEDPGGSIEATADGDHGDDTTSLGVVAESESSHTNDPYKVLAAYWRQMAKEGEIRLHAQQPTKAAIRHEVEQILLETELESKEKLFQEVKFVINHFRQRRCKNYCHEEKQLTKLVKRIGIDINLKSREFCDCGLAKMYHTEEARKNRVQKWTVIDNTELLYPYTFGNMDIPGHYNYLETPEGTRKYIRLDDLHTVPADVWDLLTTHWNLKPPNLVISVTGGDVTSLYENSRLQQSFESGILKSAVTTKAWIFTDGFHLGASREISDIFQEHLPRSKWAEFEDHANIPLIGIIPWGVIADRKNLNGIHVGLDEAVYLYTSIEQHSETTMVPNALDPYHVIYLMPDDGTTGRYHGPPNVRSQLEKYIRHETSLQLVGARDVKTPVVVLVLGGDQFTLQQVADAVHENNQFSVVIVNNSGPIATMLAETWLKLEKENPRSKEKQYGWSAEEEEDLLILVSKFECEGLLQRPKDKDNLKEIMKARHLIEVFGIGERDTQDLDKAILEAIFGGTYDIAMQLTLTLAMDRCDIAASSIFVESRKKELRDVSETLQEVLLVAMETGRKKFVELLLDQDYGGELDFKKLLTVERLYRLHVANLDPSKIMGKVLRSMCKRKNDGSYLLARHQLLPQVGRIIHTLLGVNYRLLYQEKEYREVSAREIPYGLTTHPKEEPVWHLFFWAVLAHEKEMAEVFLFETSCKIGGALIAFELLSEMAKQAVVMSETQLAEQLNTTAEYFETLAIEVLENLYAFDRDEAYATVTSVIPFHFGRYVTPLHIADDAEAMRFMGQPCCQTLLNRIWYQYMDLDTKAWKLFPLFAFFPVNLTSIVFDQKNLNYGTYRVGYEDTKHKRKALKSSVGRYRPMSESNDADNYGSNAKLEEVGADTCAVDDVGDKKTEAAKKREHINRTAWFRVKNYYTSPLNKFIFYFMAWLVFIGIFTHFLLSELRPFTTVSDITVYEWILDVWVASISLDEIKQIFAARTSGPLYKLDWHELEPDWGDTWHLHERVYFVLRLYKFTYWIEDNWNMVDMIMVFCFWASVICRFLIVPADFTIVRILYAVTIIIFYCRILRLGYIMKNIGPSVITIQHMFKDLYRFVLILLIFIFGFGVSFQAILAPNEPASWGTFVDVLWRPYWQMFGELFVDDVTTGMGRPVPNAPQCTSNRTLASLEPELHPFCYNWMAPLLLGIFMLITNILLLNLLIAIFSNSYNKIESRSRTIWSYHIYDLVHEHYHQVWLPPPLNILCHLASFCIWVFQWPRKLAYQMAKKRHTKRLQGQRRGNSLIGQGPESAFLASSLAKQVKEEIRQDCCFRFYYPDDEVSQHDANHFFQPEVMRNDDLEEKAYKRHLRNTHKQKEKNIRKMLALQNEKLTQITADLQHLRELSKEPTAADVLSDTPFVVQGAGAKLDHSGGGMEARLMNHIDKKLDAVVRAIDRNKKR